MSERLDERLRRAARTYRRLGNHTAEGMFLEAVDTICELQAENVKLRELCADLYAEMITYSKAPNYNASVWAPKLRELGAEEDA